MDKGSEKAFIGYGNPSAKIESNCWSRGLAWDKVKQKPMSME